MRTLLTGTSSAGSNSFSGTGMRKDVFLKRKAMSIWREWRNHRIAKTKETSGSGSMESIRKALATLMKPKL